MNPEARLALLDQGLQALADAVAGLDLHPVCGSPNLLLFDRSRPSDATAPDVPLLHLAPVATTLRPLADAVFLLADAEIALAHALPAATAVLLPPSSSDEIAAIDRAAQGPGSPPCGGLRWPASPACVSSGTTDATCPRI